MGYIPQWGVARYLGDLEMNTEKGSHATFYIVFFLAWLVGISSVDGVIDSHSVGGRGFAGYQLHVKSVQG